MKQKLFSALAAAAFLMAAGSASAAENPFGMNDLQQAQQVAMSSMGGKCMGGGDKAAKCSGKKASKCSGEKKAAGKCSGSK